MAKLELGINCRVDVLWEDNMYKSSIQDIKDDEILITIPVSDGIYLTLKDGNEIEQIFYDDKGNVFGYKNKVLGRTTEKDIPFYRISKPYDITRIQRRDYVRVNVVQVINYIKEEELKSNISGEEKYEHALLLDLSGGGMRIKIKEEIKASDIIIANLTYDNEKISVRGKVIRVDKSEDKKYICGINFDDIDNGTREKIIKTVFTIMRKQRELI
ncbi:PilZ domain-containing protein [Clostridium tertium]|jgi:c-di-GMP-binding flagellar brake protein YcgR|uniref:flagellar brake protein n=1 Tax=Clostridium TaxID=1485 RepID=UPI00115A983B|nr:MULTISPECIES: flagellar brake domain-containing protein [Clostridium]MBS5305005.1 PilZ domain-containing protein [Clostridium sp.]MDB1922536.1 PilZ domain-containing protein [Clostridium tertium]MDB1926247.1 PilZ domain-containing protein [Clostridium tertium]MDB1928893.1 PilZ domain-containing protein [Clostridium tertium]MDB1932279.1 PilZ domain-containing protein [Clostridium tertium]